jgi:hypothetical protein
MKVVPAGLHDGVELHPVRAELRIGAEGLDARFFDRLLVPLAAAVAARQA